MSFYLYEKEIETYTYMCVCVYAPILCFLFTANVD